MPKPFSHLFSRRKPQTLAFKDYYSNWFSTLKNDLLPLIQTSLSSSSSPTLLYSNLDLLLRHFVSYYEALDDAASPETLPHLLFPSWRNSLEIPFLFLGDLHPYFFTNLLRSFLDEDDDDNEDEDEDEYLSCRLLEPDDVSGNREFFDRPWQVVMAWKNVSNNLMGQIEQIECGLRLMVPALTGRMKKVQGDFVGKIAQEWVRSEGKRKEVEAVVGEAMKDEMEELVTVFVDANRLRKSVISEIVGALSVYQAALFLEGLAQFLVGFTDPELLGEFR